MVDARTAAVAAAQQNYDFKINLNGNIAIGMFNGFANANYDGSYRYNTANNALAFKRITSDVLLYDSVEYIYNTGSSKVKFVTNEKGEVKKSSVIPQEDEELNLINLPFVALINHIDANNLKTIIKYTSGDYQYKATLALASDNEYMQKLLNIVGNLGTSVEMGDVSLSNPANGIDFYFNLNEDKTLLNDFKFSAQVSFPVKNKPVVLTLTYEQATNDSNVVIPNTSGLIMDSTAIARELATINNAINSLKISDTYSLDLEASNKFDPGWKNKAIVDKYYSRLYKHVNDSRIDFNQSFEYKTHSEKDGAQTYKYTYGNIQNGSVYLVSRKGSNVVTEANGVTVDTQFDYMIKAATVNADSIDCIKKTTNNGRIYYNIYFKKTTSLSIKYKITDIINSNEAEGVEDVNNYFNSDNNSIEDSVMVVEMIDTDLVKITVDTQIKYCPTGGDYTEERITLTNSIILTVNAELNSAAKYTAPKSATRSMTGFNSASYYIR